MCGETASAGRERNPTPGETDSTRGETRSTRGESASPGGDTRGCYQVAVIVPVSLPPSGRAPIPTSVAVIEPCAK